jgi:hypothetical protein
LERARLVLSQLLGLLSAARFRKATEELVPETLLLQPQVTALGVVESASPTALLSSAKRTDLSFPRNGHPMRRSSAGATDPGDSVAKAFSLTSGGAGLG